MSLLYPIEPSARAESAEVQEPTYFRDVLLDRVVGDVTAGRDEYHLQAVFYAPLTSGPAIGHRQAVFRDLETPGISDALTHFGEGMRDVRQCGDLSRRLRHPRQQDRWFLEGVTRYGQTVARLTDQLVAAAPASAGLRATADYLQQYRASERFRAMTEAATALVRELAAVQHVVHIQGSRVVVRRYQGEADYGARVADTFARFRQGPVAPYQFQEAPSGDLNHIETRILELVAQLQPDVFQRLATFHRDYADYLPETVARLDRESQWYLAYHDYVERWRAAGLPVCYPTVAARPGPVVIRGAFHPALMDVMPPGQIVCNDFLLMGPEHILVVSGPNQGGKTTYARLFAVVHYLAQLGCPVPAERASVSRFDQIFTHFEREEEAGHPESKLEAELRRLRDILATATPDSIVIINEAFSATTVRDGRELGRRVLERLTTLGARTVYVTFLEELSRLSDATVSVVALMASELSGTRAFRLVRQPSDGRAYAASLAARHGLNYDHIREQLGGPPS
ncbi:MAG: hypothetical protein M0Z54_07430 [Thermaerobacter sp.]|nr:hypothetical protein [Thermaerobacter sp.]